MGFQTLQNANRECSGRLVPPSQTPPVLFQGQQELWRNVFGLGLQQLLGSLHFLVNCGLQITQFKIQTLELGEIEQKLFVMGLILKSAFFCPSAWPKYTQPSKSLFKREQNCGSKLGKCPPRLTSVCLMVSSSARRLRPTDCCCCCLSRTSMCLTIETRATIRWSCSKHS